MGKQILYAAILLFGLSLNASEPKDTRLIRVFSENSFIKSLNYNAIENTQSKQLELRFSFESMSSLIIRHDEKQIEFLALKQKSSQSATIMWLNNYEMEQRSESTFSSEKEVYESSIKYFFAQLDRKLKNAGVFTRQREAFFRQITAFIDSKTSLKSCKNSF